MTRPRVAIVVVNWKRCDDTLACLESLRQVEYQPFEVIVVDNGSQDGSAARVRIAHPEVTVIALPDNSGFVGGCNRGLSEAKARNADYVLLLNNDTTVAPDFLTNLVAAAAPDDVGAVGPAIYFHAQPELAWSKGGAIDWHRGTTAMLGLCERDGTAPTAPPLAVDFVSGCCLLAKMTAVDRAGPLDDRFFAYYEEVEWCTRIHRAGFQILHVPSARVWHKIDPPAQQTSPTVLYFMTRNRLLFLWLTRAPISAWMYAGLDDLRTVASWSLRPRWRARRRLRGVILQAWADFCRGRFGPMRRGA